jgi:hypothetical protein
VRAFIERDKNRVRVLIERDLLKEIRIVMTSFNIYIYQVKFFTSNRTEERETSVNFFWFLIFCSVK